MIVKRKNRIGIVLGQKDPNLILPLFENLMPEYEVFVYTFQKKSFYTTYPTSFHFKLYKELEDMPGFMKGLEEEMSQLDLIIAVETSQISSFQASRAASKFKKRFVVYSSEWQAGVYKAYKNVKAIQHGINEQSDLFWVPALICKDQLMLDGVQEQKIKTIPYHLTNSIYHFDAKKREKFRKYIKFGRNDFVILVQADLKPEFNYMELLLALKEMVADEAYQQLKLVFVGDGDVAKDIKYQCFDLGLSEYVAFLHQDIRPFQQDLYSASDLALHPNYEVVNHLYPYPFHVFQQVISGLPQVACLTGLVGDMLEDGFLKLRTWNRFELGRVLKQCFDENFLASERKRQMECFKSKISQVSIEQEIHTLLKSEGSEEQNFESKKAGVEADIKDGKLNEALRRIESLNDSCQCDFEKSELCRLQGDIDYAKGNHEMSLRFYQKSLHLNYMNEFSYNGLGYLSWQSHSNEEAMKFFRKALAINPQSARAMLGIGLVHRRVGLLKSALYWFEKSLMIDESLSAMAAFIKTCEDCSDTRDVILILQRLIDTVGEEQALMICLGNIYLKDGQVSKGQMVLSKAI